MSRRHITMIGYIDTRHNCSATNVFYTLSVRVWGAICPFSPSGFTFSSKSPVIRPFNFSFRVAADTVNIIHRVSPIIMIMK